MNKVDTIILICICVIIAIVFYFLYTTLLQDVEHLDTDSLPVEEMYQVEFVNIVDSAVSAKPYDEDSAANVVYDSSRWAIMLYDCK